ncbi:MAG: DUF2281 domain-containing protein [Methanoregulaceae archaeon]|nr:DUF2281 domain-containing protein [Methanoregulaceae archaeon]
MIEEKIARLPPELRQEVEDFTDYLLKRYGEYQQKDDDSAPELAQVLLAEECNPFDTEKDSPSPALLELNVLEAAGGRTEDEGHEKKIADILDWIE